MDKAINDKDTNELEKIDPYSPILSLEDCLKVIANLVVDRIIENQQNNIIQTDLNNK